MQGQACARLGVIRPGQGAMDGSGANCDFEMAQRCVAAMHTLRRLAGDTALAELRDALRKPTQRRQAREERMISDAADALRACSGDNAPRLLPSGCAVPVAPSAPHLLSQDSRQREAQLALLPMLHGLLLDASAAYTLMDHSGGDFPLPVVKALEERIARLEAEIKSLQTVARPWDEM